MIPKSSNGLVLRIVVELLFAALTAFALTGFAAPMLMDVRNTVAFWAGAACWPLAALVVVVAAVWIVRDLKALRRLRGDPARLFGPE